MSGGVLVAVLCVLVACGDSAAIDPERPTPKLDAPATVTIVEGERRTFVVKLVEAPLEDVMIAISSRDPAAAIVETETITLTSASYATGVEVTVRGVEDDDDVINEPVELVLAIGDDVAARVAATVMDNDVQQLVIDPPNLSLVEGTTATFAVRLARTPEAPVSVLLDANAPTLATATPTMLTFGPGDYATPQTVVVTALADADTTNNTTSISARGASIVTPLAVTIEITDDDVQALVLSAQAVPLAEGGTGSFTVALAFDPGAPTVVDVQSSDPQILETTSSLVFDSTNYAVPQPVTLTGVEDVDQLHDTATATLTLAGPVTASVTVPITDNDDISASGSTVVSEGRLAHVDVWLANDPGPSGRTVTLEVVSGNVVLLTDTLTFTSATYATTQTAWVYAAVDPSSSNTSAMVRATYAGQTPRDLPLTILHREEAGTLRALSLWRESWTAGAQGWLEVQLQVDSIWPGDGRLVVTFPPGYDASGATVDATDIDGSLSATATTSTITLTRAGGTAIFGGTHGTVRLGNIRNPGVSGDYPVTAETQTASGEPLDRRTANDRIFTAALTGASVTLATLATAATGSVTIAFTTTNPWPANGVVDVSFPPGFDVATATLAAQTGVDGALGTSMPAPARLRLTRAGGTALPGGSAVAIVVGNITNPPTSHVTTDFGVLTADASGAGIDVARAPGVTIGCPQIMSKIAHAARNVPFGGDAWTCPECATDLVGPLEAEIRGLVASDYLVLDDFQLSVPEGATITGIRFDVTRASAGTATDSAVRAVASTIGVADRSMSTPWQYAETVSYGGSTDLWGQAWSAEDIQSPTFGIALAAQASAPANVAVRYVTAVVFLSCPP